MSFHCGARRNAVALTRGTGGSKHKPQNTLVLDMGTPKKVLLILGNPHLGGRWKSSYWMWIHHKFWGPLFGGPSIKLGSPYCGNFLMGGCQNYGPLFKGIQKDHNFDNHPYYVPKGDV